MLALYLSIFLVSKTSGLLCTDVSKNTEELVWTTEELANMTGEEMDKCVSHLGKVKIPLEQAKIIWNGLMDYYGGANDVPEDRLNSLHWITIAIQPKHFKNMTLSSIDVIENFGLFYDLSSAQLEAIATRIREDWGGKTPEDYTSYDLMALRQIICAFDPQEIIRIHPLAYKDAAASLGFLKSCPQEVLVALAALAIDEKAFGQPDKWTESIISALGVVMDGLPIHKLKMIPDYLIKEVKERLAKITRESFSKAKSTTNTTRETKVFYDKHIM